jgi:hypothetical protein
MEIPRDMLIPVLTNKVKAVFKLFSGKHELCGERHLTVGRKSYAVADILSTNKINLDQISQKDIELGGFKTKDEFIIWWFAQGYREFNPIYIVRFELLRIKPLGKWWLKKNNLNIPVIKEDLGDYDE